MPEMRLVTYCGLYCGLCAQCNRIPKQSGELRRSMQKEGWDHWGKDIHYFKEFWQFLDGLASAEADCSCRDGKCGQPFCGIRKCAQGKGVDVCPFCDEYPCHRIEALAEGYINLLADGKRMRQIGLDRWIEEQETRKTTGFSYVDIRCYPFSVPNE